MHRSGSGSASRLRYPLLKKFAPVVAAALFLIGIDLAVRESHELPPGNQAGTAGFDRAVSQAEQVRVFQFRTIAPPGQEGEIDAFTSAPDSTPYGPVESVNQQLMVDDRGRFYLSAYWYVKDRGYMWLEADNGGEYYSSETSPRLMLLNLELAKSRVMRNRKVLDRYEAQGLKPTAKLIQLLRQAEEKFAEAEKAESEQDKASISDQALLDAIAAGEELEIAWANHLIGQPGFQAPLIGADSRHYVWSNIESMNRYVPQLIDYATITHYVHDGWFPPFEPREGDLRWGIRTEIYNWLKDYGIEVQARPVFWPHESVTPEWLRKKSFEELKVYVRNHAKAMVEQWGDRITRWEIANEMHDWANVHNLTPAQITEVIRIISKTIRGVQPHATLIVNHTNIFGEYAGMSEVRGPVRRPRSPYQFARELVDAGVDFDQIGLQVYRPERDLSDLVRLIERFETLGKKIIISEVGAPSYYDYELPEVGPEEARWTETAQANWAENVFRVLGSRPSIDVICWYDLTDFRSFVHNGGVLTAEDALPKEVFTRLLRLKQEWKKAESREG